MISAFSILAQSDDSVVERHLTLHPPTPFWLPPWAYYLTLLLFLVLAVVATIYLYVAQSKVASRRIIWILTSIRTLLIGLMFITLVGAGCQFTHTGSSEGSLWLMLDRSGSMAQTDPQSTPIERLRWADALGYLPAEVRPSPLGRQSAKLMLIRQDLAALQASTNQPVEPQDAKPKLDELVKGLRKWAEQVGQVADAVERDPAGVKETKSIQGLRSAIKSVNAGVEKAAGRSKPEEAAGDIAWKDAVGQIDPAIASLRTAADTADRALLARNDPRVKEATDKVAKLSRAQLADAVLTVKNDASRNDPSRKGPTGYEELLPKQTLKLMSFGDNPQVILPEKADGEAKKAIDAALAKPNAPVTDYVTGLRLIHDQVGQNEPASVIILSDGRDNRKAGDLNDAARRLSARGIHVYAAAFGSQEVAPDVAVEKIDAPDWIFKGDAAKVSALLRLDGVPGKTVDVELYRVGLKDGSKEELIGLKQVTASSSGPQDHKVVTFTETKDQLAGAGLYDYRVVVKPVENEVVPENNSQTARISVKDHKLAALMIEDQPRWEYRYIMSYLSRDTRVKLQTVLLQAARIEKVNPPPPVKASPDNEKQEAQLLPETEEEWYKFDVIILGDVPPEYLPKKQQENLAKAVKDRGATLIFIGGPLNMPSNWGSGKTDNPLSELFPVEASPEWTPQALQRHLKLGYYPVIAPDGNNHILTQLDINDQKNAAAWAQIKAEEDAAWYWHSDFTQARGGAQVIWSIADRELPNQPKPASNEPAAFESANRRALLSTMNAGVGKVMFLSGDATWRFRQVNGQNYHERFWGQVVRWVVGNDLPAGGQFVKFGTDKPKYVDGESAIVTARLSDKKLAPLKGQKVKVVARQVVPGAKADPNAPTRVEAEMVESPESPGQYRAILGNLPAGQVAIELLGSEVQALMTDDPTAEQKSLLIEVAKGLNLEQKNVNADRATLGSVAVAGGGAMVEGYYADVIADHIPELNYKVTKAEQLGLFADPRDSWTRWTHYIFLGLFIVLISTEWILRKVGGLV